MEICSVTEVWQAALVYEVRIKAFVEKQNIPIHLEFDEIYGEKYHYVLLYEGTQGIGTARINFSEKEYAKIERVAITPEHQQHGLGRQLIAAAEEWIREAGYQKIVITSQTQAAGFYEKLGYRIRTDIHLESDIPIVYTEKNIGKVRS